MSNVKILEVLQNRKRELLADIQKLADKAAEIVAPYKTDDIAKLDENIRQSNILCAKYAEVCYLISKICE